MADCMPPPSYYEATGQVESGGNLTFVDFMPQCVEEGGIFSSPVYEHFGDVINRANGWLRTHTQYEVKTCESVEFKYRGNDLKTEKMTYMESGKYRTSYLRGLRLWLVLSKDHTRYAHQIGYINLVPEQTQSSFFGSSTYETLGEVLANFNTRIRSSPLPGRILNVESQEMKNPSSVHLNPDKSYWTEFGDYRTQFIIVIRVFYEVSQVRPAEEIGIVDFTPRLICEGGFFSHPKYEPFSNLVQQAYHWCSQQFGIRFCNAQSFEIKMKSDGNLSTQRMSYTEHGDRSTYYIRILRVAYTKLLYTDGPVMHVPLHLTCKTFAPLPVETGLFTKFESLSKTRERIEAWIKATGARVLSAETSAMRLCSGGEYHYGTEATYTFNRSDRNETWVFVIRVYINGTYREPPTDVLPEVPVPEDCCAIL